MLFTFKYTLLVEQLKQWVETNKYLCEGPLSFVARGIEVVIINHQKLDKTSFSIDDAEGERIWLQLLEKPMEFRIHRNLFGGKEWDCFIAE